MRCVRDPHYPSVRSQAGFVCLLPAWSDVSTFEEIPPSLTLGLKDQQRCNNQGSPTRIPDTRRTQVKGLIDKRYGEATRRDGSGYSHFPIFKERPHVGSEQPHAQGHHCESENDAQGGQIPRKRTPRPSSSPSSEPHGSHGCSRRARRPPPHGWTPGRGTDLPFDARHEKIPRIEQPHHLQVLPKRSFEGQSRNHWRSGQDDVANWLYHRYVHWQSRAPVTEYNPSES